MALGVQQACWRALPEALSQPRPWDEDRRETGGLGADPADDHYPDAADLPADAGSLPVHQDRPADGAGIWAAREPASPDAYLLPAKLAAAVLDAAAPVAEPCTPDGVRFAERSCGALASADAAAHPAVDGPELPESQQRAVPPAESQVWQPLRASRHLLEQRSAVPEFAARQALSPAASRAQS
jgi:hypothetical protein